MTERRRAAVQLSCLVVLLAVALAGLQALDGGPLAPPPLGGGRAALDRWLESRSPPAAAFAVIRLVAVALGWYLLATTVAAFALAALHATRAAALMEASTLPPLRRLSRALTGFSLAASALPLAALAGLPGWAAAATSSHPERAVDARRGLDNDEVMEKTPEEDVIMRGLPDEPAVATPPGGAQGDRAAGEGASWPVLRGDHFWRVAEEVLAASWARMPTDAEITGYWRILVEVNRSVLVDPRNPDLLFPGQVLRVPPPPPVPGYQRGSGGYVRE